MFDNVLQNVTKHHNRFAGHAAPAHWPVYLGHRHTLEYLRSFAKRFGLRARVRLRSEVSRVEKNVDDGSFSVTVRRTEAFPAFVNDKAKAKAKANANATTKKKPRYASCAFFPPPENNAPEETPDEETHVFDAVCVCTGQLSRPKKISCPGIESFPGKVMHSSAYRVPGDLARKRVLIVGVGAASGSDVAQDACGAARSGAFCTLVPIRPRWRGERRFLRTTSPFVSVRPSLALDPRPPSTPFNSVRRL